MTEDKTHSSTPYVVIARRYRPQTFAEIIGQEPIVRTLRNSIREDRIPHAWLFAGIRGVGKTTTARVLAKALNCENRNAEEPCNTCVSCTDITEGRSLDTLEIDGASNRGIDQIRELRESVRSYPARDRSRILIIDEVHMLTREAFNALLKTLEEPPPHVRFILATTELQKVPDTILSRCQVFEFRRIPPETMEREMGRIAGQEGIKISSRGLSLLARCAEGSLRDAQGLLEQAIAFCGKEIQDAPLEELLGVTDIARLRQFVRGIADKDAKTLLLLIDSMIQEGSDPLRFCRDLQAYIRDLLLVRSGLEAEAGILLQETDPSEARKVAERFSEDQLIRIFQLLVRDEPAIRYSNYPRYLLEVLATKLARLADLTAIEQLVAEVRGAGRTGLGGDPASGEGGGAPGGEMDQGNLQFTGEKRPPEGNREPEASRSPDDPVQSILDRLHTRKASLWAFLGTATRFEIDGDRVRITFPERHGFGRQTVLERGNLNLLRETCREILGRTVRVEVEEETERTRDLASVTERNHQELLRKRLLDSALREPVVQNLLDTFQGEILEVRELEKPEG